MRKGYLTMAYFFQEPSHTFSEYLLAVSYTHLTLPTKA